MDLIAQGHDSHPSRFTRAFRKHSQILKVLGILGILAATFAILLRSLLSEKEVWQAPSATRTLESAQISQSSPLRLNPKDHIFRESRALYHSWNITREQRRPDGVLKSVYLINGLFPGPVLEARSGDRLIVTVNNKLDNGDTTSIHWHGLSMRSANEMDGIAGVTQDPIRPGQSFVYDFDIEHDQHGTFWYHAHDGTQKADGMYGGLIVHKPADTAILDNDRQSTDEYLVIAGDWYHRSGRDALEFYMHPGSFGIEPVPDNILINGRGNFNCSKVVPARPVDCVDGSEEQELLRLSKSLSLLRIINAGSFAPFSIKSAGALLTPVAIDGHAIQISTAQSVGVLPPGGRVDLLFHAGKTSAGEEMAIELHLYETGFKYPNPVLIASRTIKVECNQFAVEDDSNNNTLEPERADVDLATVRSQGHMDDLPEQADETIVLYAITQKLAHLKNEPHGFINNTSWGQNDTSVPLIRLPEETRAQSYFIPHIQYNASSPLWVDLVLNNLDEEHHPFHLHGHSFYVLATYSSDYNWGSYNPFATSDPPGGPYDLEHPAKKDTLLVPRRGYAVLRFRADNPGIWMFHCHALWHEASGMAMALEIA